VRTFSRLSCAFPKNVRTFSGPNHPFFAPKHPVYPLTHPFNPLLNKRLPANQ
jgi:hypothetical protein